MSLDNFYEHCYQTLMSEGSIGKAWGFVHRSMEKPYPNLHGMKILEIGAGNGEHLKFVSRDFARYYATDIREKNLENILGGEKVVKEIQNAQSLTYKDNFFDRVIITCVLVHLEKPENAIAEMRRVIKAKGIVSIYLPCEPGIFLRVIRHYTTRRKAKKLNIGNIEFLHYLEHRNYYIAVHHFIKKEFEGSKIERRYFPFRFFTWNFNLYALYNITVEK